jgi:hypothetical protein
MLPFTRNSSPGIAGERGALVEQLRSSLKALSRSVASFFFWCGIICLVVAAYLAVKQVYVLLTWPEVMAKVLSSQVVSVSSDTGPDGSPTYGVVVRFQYQVAGKEYLQSAKTPWSSNITWYVQWKVDRFSPGTTHPIRYNPADPADIQFDVGYDFETFTPTILAGVLGVLLIWPSLYSASRKIGIRGKS